eukprot:11203089-Lingulodinium_polyedra.AAC.1
MSQEKFLGSTWAATWGASWGASWGALLEPKEEGQNSSPLGPAPEARLQNRLPSSAYAERPMDSMCTCCRAKGWQALGNQPQI